MQAIRNVFSCVDLRMEVFESQKFKFRLFLSRTGFGRVQLVTEGMVGRLCKSVPSGNGTDTRESGQKVGRHGFSCRDVIYLTLSH